MNNQSFIEDSEVVSAVSEYVGDKCRNLDADQVNLNFQHTSGFVLGKQTNFHGPVTIVNQPQNESDLRKDNVIILQDKVIPTETTRVIGDKLSNIQADSVYLSRNNTCSKESKEEVSLVKRNCYKCIYSRCFGWAISIILVSSFLTLIFLLIFNNNGRPYSREPHRPNQSRDQSHHPKSDHHPEDHPPQFTHDNYLQTGGFIITKDMWGGLKESSSVKIKPPIPYVVISHTAGSHCYDQETCKSLLRDMQKDLMSRTPAFADIAYSFMVGGDGNVYEGRGWRRRSPLVGFVDNKNYDITFLGDFSVYSSPTIPQFEAVQRWLQFAVENDYITKDYVLMAANASDNGPTLSPGKNVYNEIKTWPHFQADPISYNSKQIPPE